MIKIDNSTDLMGKATDGKVQLQKKNVLIGCTGSVATIKLGNIIEQLQASKYQMDVQVVATCNALRFFDKSTIQVPVHTDEHEWKEWRKRGDPVLHIELRRWADIYVIAPLDANTLGKMASGICDNLLTCIVRAWDVSKPLLFAPAMNTLMWNHPITSEQVKRLKTFGYEEIPCVEKVLVCGERGSGAMAEVTTIARKIEEELEKINGLDCANKDFSNMATKDNEGKLL